MTDPRLIEAMESIAAGLNNIAEALHRLGINHASSPLGAMELLAMEVRGLGERMGGHDEP